MFNIEVIIHETYFDIISSKEEKIQKKALDVISNWEKYWRKYIYEMSGSISTYLIKEMSADSAIIIWEMEDPERKDFLQKKKKIELWSPLNKSVIKNKFENVQTFILDTLKTNERVKPNSRKVFEFLKLLFERFALRAPVSYTPIPHI
jgi:hypothetical protein